MIKMKCMDKKIDFAQLLVILNLINDRLIFQKEVKYR